MTPSHISVLTRKKITLWLLAGSCLAALLILSGYPSKSHKQLDDLARADSLIRTELALFNIEGEHVQVHEYKVNDDFTRKHYVVDLPVQVSKTHLHAELNRQLQPWHVETIGYVDVPEDELTLHIIYQDKVIRTLDLRTDPDYIRVPHPAELLVYFNRRPTDSQIARIRALGIPVGVVLRSTSRRSLHRWVEHLPEDISPLWIWFDDGERAYRETVPDDAELFQSLETVSRIHEDIRLLVFGEEMEESSAAMQRLESQGIGVTHAGGMNIISSDERFEFDRQMLSFSRTARLAGGPRLLVRGSDRTLGWLEEWIPRIRRGGVLFVNSS